MTGAEILESFYVHYDRVTSFSAPGYESSEALLFLNNAQDQFIKDKVFGQNFQPPAFEDNQKRVVDILPLIVRESIATGANIVADPLLGASAYKINVSAVGSSRLLYVVELEVRVTRTNPTATNVYYKCQNIKSKYSGNFVISATNRTQFLYPKYFQTQGYIHVMADYYTSLINYVKLSVIRRPYPITAASLEYDGTYAGTHMSLDSFTHQEIVNIAVQNAFQAISDPRWQTKVNQENLDTN